MHKLYGFPSVSKLTCCNFITFIKKEYLLLLRSQRFLSKTRFFLHLINNRPEERLFFSNQKKLAEFFGYFSDTNKGVERFMQEFYKHISVVKQLNEILIKHIEDINGKKHLKKDFLKTYRIYQITKLK